MACRKDLAKKINEVLATMDLGSIKGPFHLSEFDNEGQRGWDLPVKGGLVTWASYKKTKEGDEEIRCLYMPLPPRYEREGIHKRENRCLVAGEEYYSGHNDGRWRPPVVKFAGSEGND